VAARHLRVGVSSTVFPRVRIMNSVSSRSARRLRHATFLLLVSWPTLGCGDDSGVGKTYPVAGKVTLDDEPLTAMSGTVLFKPDASKGNTSSFEPVGNLDEQGNYTLNTKGKKGAPPGWYKVIVTATGEMLPAKGNVHPRPKSLVPAKYGQDKTTNLFIEVVDDPAAGAYDLKLTK
jgi:hypothetical protein